MENLYCTNCPFTCKGSKECKPRQLLNEIRSYLPSVIDENSCTIIPTMTKPSISCSININGQNFYF